MSTIRGEYWICENNEVVYADGDIGDSNHESLAREACMGLILGMFNLDVPETGHITELPVYIAGAYAEELEKDKEYDIDELAEKILGLPSHSETFKDLMMLATAIASRTCTEYVFHEKGWICVKKDRFSFPWFPSVPGAVADAIDAVLEADNVDSVDIDEDACPELFFMSSSHTVRDMTYGEILAGCDIPAPPNMPIHLLPFVPPPQKVPVVDALRNIDHYGQHYFYLNRTGYPFVSSD